MEEKDQFCALTRMKNKHIKEFVETIKPWDEKLTSNLAEIQRLQLEPESQKKSESSESESDLVSESTHEDADTSSSQDNTTDLEATWIPPNCKVCVMKFIKVLLVLIIFYKMITDNDVLLKF